MALDDAIANSELEPDIELTSTALVWFTTFIVTLETGVSNLDDWSAGWDEPFGVSDVTEVLKPSGLAVGERLNISGGEWVRRAGEWLAEGFVLVYSTDNVWCIDRDICEGLGLSVLKVTDVDGVLFFAGATEAAWDKLGVCAGAGGVERPVPVTRRLEEEMSDMYPRPPDDAAKLWSDVAKVCFSRTAGELTMDAFDACTTLATPEICEETIGDAADLGSAWCDDGPAGAGGVERPVPATGRSEEEMSDMYPRPPDDAAKLWSDVAKVCFSRTAGELTMDAFDACTTLATPEICEETIGDAADLGSAWCDDGPAGAGGVERPVPATGRSEEEMSDMYPRPPDDAAKLWSDVAKVCFSRTAGELTMDAFDACTTLATPEICEETIGDAAGLGSAWCDDGPAENRVLVDLANDLTVLCDNPSGDSLTRKDETVALARADTATVSRFDETGLAPVVWEGETKPMVAFQTPGLRFVPTDAMVVSAMDVFTGTISDECP